MFPISRWHSSIFFWLILALCAAIYSPGLRGGFLFDDAPNLSYLGTFGGVKDWDTFQAFVLGGIAGPLGRPVALTTFLLDDVTWPSAAQGFKYTNLCIHLLTGVVLCWCTLLLIRLYTNEKATATWGALLNMAVWLLHPYMVSTTLYVVQRMAQLAALFIFAGLAGYLHGRLLLRDRPRRAYAWMSMSLILGTVFAAFSKENGVLLPLLAWVIEWCIPQPKEITPDAPVKSIVRPDWRWQALFLWLPTVGILGALASYIDFSANPWPTRPFNQIERLLSEARIVWEYLFHLWVPRIEGRGLFQDAFEISKGLMEPASTCISILGIAGLLALAVWMRKKSLYGALTALGLLFFFSSHLMESTVIGLELYFEHRNYAAAAFLFLPLIIGLIWVADHRSRFVVVCTLAALIIVLASLTWQRARLWANTDSLQTYWAVTNENSARAQNYLAAQMLRNGAPEQALAFLESAAERLPGSSLLSMQWLHMKVQLQQATAQDFQRVKRSLALQRFDAQAIMGVRAITEILSTSTAKPADREQAAELLAEMGSLPQYTVVPLFQRMLPYLRGLLLIGQGDADTATKQMLEAIKLYRETDAALSMVADMAKAGHPRHALHLLEAAREVYAVQADRSLKRSRSVYDMEFARLDDMLRKDLSAQQ